MKREKTMKRSLIVLAIMTIMLFAMTITASAAGSVTKLRQTSASSSSVKVTWNANPGQEYRVYYSKSKNSGYVEDTSYTTSSTEWYISGLSAGTTYYVKVASYVEDSNWNDIYVATSAPIQVVTTPESAGIEQLPEMQVTENVKADKTAANDTSDQMNSVLKEENTVQTASDADEVEIQKPEDNILLQKEVAEETDTKADDGQTGNRNESGNTSNQTAFVSQEHTVDPAAAKTPETVPEFSRQLDTLDLIRQVTEFTKVTVREAQTTMEMQLNPEHLGKLYIEVTTKEGNVSAHIMTQNELVKEALESQMAELKQSMNQAGVKVDAVEVTVGSHEFEKNLEQNAKQDERQAEEQEKASPKTRRINLDELDELSGVMSEEEALVAQIMADHGNSVDYTA